MQEAILRTIDRTRRCKNDPSSKSSRQLADRGRIDLLGQFLIHGASAVSHQGREPDDCVSPPQMRLQSAPIADVAQHEINGLPIGFFINERVVNSEFMIGPGESVGKRPPHITSPGNDEYFSHEATEGLSSYHN